MRFSVLAVMAFLLACLSGTSLAATGQQLELARECLELSGTNSSLEAIPLALEAFSRQQQLTEESPEETVLLASLFRESYDIAQAKEQLADYLLQHLKPDQLAKIQADLKEPWLKAITHEEMLANDTNARAELLRYLADLQLTPPTAERIALIQELEKVAQASAWGTELSVNIVRGMMKNVSAADDEDAQEEIDDFIDQLQPTIAKSMRQQILLGMFYTYRNISDADLQKYIAYTNTDDAQDFLTTTHAGLLEILSQTFVHAGNQLVELKKAKQPKDQ